ncbi:hypothetical protein MKUB_10860 [Mycobacterium kubicae]|uniref:PE family protein n=1 Tax=Mycobacterium kubicae TaxID=120959 RepID=A0ABQ1BIX4_9MYCO|nr:hypothetical protein A5657_18975 [Mycobacterium kubicae]ORW05521.1 hypothetical protein AWC13_25485 [Mycobacterium kubicae]GFG63596.1 hypothetical protein MKUB_10860 [Mycobacterium kubicae]
MKDRLRFDRGVLRRRDRRVLRRGRRVLDRRLRLRLRRVNHRRVRAAVARCAALPGRPARRLDDGSATRGRRDRPAGTCAALDDRAVASWDGRAVVAGRDAAVRASATVVAAPRMEAAAGIGTATRVATGAGVDPTATAERGTFFADDAAVCSGSGSAARRSTRNVSAPGSGGRDASGRRLCAYSSAGSGRGGWLRARVGAHGVALARQSVTACVAADSQAGATGCTGLTAHSDATQRARDVRCCSAVERGPFAGDQAGLAAGATGQHCVAAGQTTDVSGTGQSPASGKIRLTGETGLAGETRLTR